MRTFALYSEKTSYFLKFMMGPLGQGESIFGDFVRTSFMDVSLRRSRDSYKPCRENFNILFF